MQNAIKPEWIALDFGANPPVAIAFSGGGVIDQTSLNTGGDINGCVAALATEWDIVKGTCVIVSGSGPAQLGAKAWTVPCRPIAGTLAETGAGLVKIYTLPQIWQKEPPAVMSSDHIAIAGFLALNKDWDGVICVVDSHSQWAQVSAGEIVSFQTFLSEHLAELIAPEVLGSPQKAPWDIEIFQTAVANHISRPERFASALAQIKAKSIFGVQTSLEDIHGALIAAELAASKPYWLGQNVAIIGPGDIANRYAQALETQGVPATIAPSARMRQEGLILAHRSLEK